METGTAEKREKKTHISNSWQFYCKFGCYWETWLAGRALNVCGYFSKQKTSAFRWWNNGRWYRIVHNWYIGMWFDSMISRQCWKIFVKVYVVWECGVSPRFASCFLCYSILFGLRAFCCAFGTLFWLLYLCICYIHTHNIYIHIICANVRLTVVCPFRASSSQGYGIYLWLKSVIDALFPILFNPHLSLSPSLQQPKTHIKSG